MKYVLLSFLKDTSVKEESVNLGITQAAQHVHRSGDARPETRRPEPVQRHQGHMGTSRGGGWEGSIHSHLANKAKTPLGMHWVQLGTPEKVLEQSGEVPVSLATKPRLEQAKEASYAAERASHTCSSLLHIM